MATLAKFNVRDVSVLVANIEAYIHQLSEEGCTDTDRHRPLLHDLIKDYVPHRVKSTTHVTLDDDNGDTPLVETLEEEPHKLGYLHGLFARDKSVEVAGRLGEVVLQEKDHARAVPLAEDREHAQRTPKLDLVGGSDLGDVHDQDLLPRPNHLVVTRAAVYPFLKGDPDHIQDLPGEEHEDLVDQAIRPGSFSSSHAVSGLKEMMQGKMHPLMSPLGMLLKTLTFKSMKATPFFIRRLHA